MSWPYDSKEDLIREINKRSNLFISEFVDIKEDEKDILIPGVDRTPAQMLAYQLGWMNLVRSWDMLELLGEDVQTPSKDFKWNQLGALYNSFYEEYKDYTLASLVEQFSQMIKIYNNWILVLNDDELFVQGIRKYTGTNPKWPLARYIHINTVAAFKTFRARIRKWKRLKIEPHHFDMTLKDVRP